MTQVISVLSRIESDIALLRTLIADQPTQQATVKVPVLKSSYTARAAVREKARIDAAFQAGLISGDKRRGMKMVVTKSTTD